VLHELLGHPGHIGLGNHQILPVRPETADMEPPERATRLPDPHHGPGILGGKDAATHAPHGTTTAGTTVGPRHDDSRNPDSGTTGASTTTAEERDPLKIGGL